MSFIAAERIKLTSTRSPWWSAAVGVAATIGVGSISMIADGDTGLPGVASTQLGYGLGMAVVMVMATLAVTTEYSVGMIRTTFLAVPNRTVALLAKTFVVALGAGLVGLLAAFGSWALGLALLPGTDLALHGAVEWRQVGGVGLVYLVAAVFSVAVGILVRHTAGAVALVLTWALMVEQLVALIPGLESVATWLPFQAAKQFLLAGQIPDGAGLTEQPWGAMGYFAAVCAGLLAVAIAVAKRRDA
jgi:ABC-2 type transport system permease protein